MKKHHYFALAWAIWNLTFSNFLISFLPENIIHFFLGMWMPAISAILFLWIEKSPIKSGINWGIGNRKSYFYAFLLPVLIALITVSIGFITKSLTFNKTHTLPLIGSVLTFLIWIASSLGEEIGWRGYLHNHLQDLKHSPLIIGLIWGMWHYNDLLSANTSIWMRISFITLTILISYLLAWILDLGGTVLACGIFHGVWNFLKFKILFGNPLHNTNGYLITSDLDKVSTEGFYGLLASFIVTLPFIFYWYRRKSRTSLA